MLHASLSPHLAFYNCILIYKNWINTINNYILFKVGPIAAFDETI